MKIKSLLLAIGLLCITRVGQGACITTAELTAPATRFFSIDQSASDILTGLEWSRCALGQNFEDERCVGTPTSFDTLSEALAAVDNANTVRLFQQQDWRLPNLKELMTIVEWSCHTPAITEAIFPDTPPGPFISSTPNATLTAPLFVDFRFGTQLVEFSNPNRYIRLVRNR